MDLRSTKDALLARLYPQPEQDKYLRFQLTEGTGSVDSLNPEETAAFESALSLSAAVADVLREFALRIDATSLENREDIVAFLLDFERARYGDFDLGGER